jgi:hypothetical protein
VRARCCDHNFTSNSRFNGGRARKCGAGSTVVPGQNLEIATPIPLNDLRASSLAVARRGQVLHSARNHERTRACFMRETVSGPRSSRGTMPPKCAPHPSRPLRWGEGLTAPLSPTRNLKARTCQASCPRPGLRSPSYRVWVPMCNTRRNTMR